MKFTKKSRFVFLLVFALLFTDSASAQRSLGGTVVEVIDGKTVVIAINSGGKITAELQFIEVPEARQELHQTVKDHLQKLIFGKSVEFLPQRIVKTRTVGRIRLNGTDISQQMLRDGAAWYTIAEKSAQAASESEIYQSNEALAKAERRGVWSIEDLKPSWQIRAEAEENRAREEKLAAAEAKKNEAAIFVEAAKNRQKPGARRQMDSESQMWARAPESDVTTPENVSSVGGLLVGYNPATKLGMVATPLLRLEVLDKNNRQAVGIGIAYLYRDDQTNGRKTAYLVGVESVSKDLKFLKYNDLTITTGKQKTVVGKAKRTVTENGGAVKEMLYYKINRNFLAKIAVQNAEVKVGAYSGKVSADIQAMLVNLLKMTE